MIQSVSFDLISVFVWYLCWTPFCFVKVGPLVHCNLCFTLLFNMGDNSCLFFFNSCLFLCTKCQNIIRMHIDDLQILFLSAYSKKTLFFYCVKVNNLKPYFLFNKQKLCFCSHELLWIFFLCSHLNMWLCYYQHSKTSFKFSYF